MTCQDNLIEFREKMEMLKRREAEISVSSDLRIRELQAILIVHE